MNFLATSPAVPEQFKYIKEQRIDIGRNYMAKSSQVQFQKGMSLSMFLRMREALPTPAQGPAAARRVRPPDFSRVRNALRARQAAVFDLAAAIF